MLSNEIDEIDDFNLLNSAGVLVHVVDWFVSKHGCLKLERAWQRWKRITSQIGSTNVDWWLLNALHGAHLQVTL